MKIPIRFSPLTLFHALFIPAPYWTLGHCRKKLTFTTVTLPNISLNGSLFFFFVRHVEFLGGFPLHTRSQTAVPGSWFLVPGSWFPVPRFPLPILVTSFLCGISHTLPTPAKFIYLFIYLFVHENKAFVTWFLFGV